ncbi:MAG: hypothetical protein Q8903_08560 [Bacteroidota bacterium]|nr:hypothetical protein [Bacteroidota bacterium]
MRLNITIILISIYFFAGCCANNAVKDNAPGAKQTVKIPNNQPKIELNRSIVLAEVITPLVSESGVKYLEYRVINVFDDGAYTSLAEKNTVYKAAVNYVLNNKNQIDVTTEINKKLMELSALKSHDKVKLAVELNETSGWLINENLGKEKE